MRIVSEWVPKWGRHEEIVTSNLSLEVTEAFVAQLYPPPSPSHINQFLDSRKPLIWLFFFFFLKKIKDKKLTMTSRIPTSASVSESAVIEAPLSIVWHLIKLQDFSKFWSKLEKSEYEKGTSPETDIVKWTFKDGTVLDVKQEEHSVGILFLFLFFTNKISSCCLLLKTQKKKKKDKLLSKRDSDCY